MRELPRRRLDEFERQELLKGIFRRYRVGEQAAVMAGFVPGARREEPDWTKPQIWQERDWRADPSQHPSWED